MQKITEILRLYANHPGVKQLNTLIGKSGIRNIQVEGLSASSISMVFGALYQQQSGVRKKNTCVFIMNDEDEAGYLYQDLIQALGEGNVLMYPSSYRRAIKYACQDDANIILRSQVQHRIIDSSSPFCMVTYPEALSELVPSPNTIASNTFSLKIGDTMSMEDLGVKLKDWGFHCVDYVYSPGEYAFRGSLVDVFSYSLNEPFRIDFFDDKIDSIRIFEIETQLSKEKCDKVTLSSNSSMEGCGRESFFNILPQDTVLFVKDTEYVKDRIEQIYKEGFVTQAIVNNWELSDREDKALDREEMLINPSCFNAHFDNLRHVFLGNRTGEGLPQAVVRFHTTAQPLFHKNFELLGQTFERYMKEGFKSFILADSAKQHERLKEIFEEKQSKPMFTSIGQTLHEGYVDKDLKIVLFTDHQIFDRFHKYNLYNEHVRNGKLALTIKELNQLEPGDFVVHVDHGIGRFAGLVRISSGGTMQEVIKLVYQHEDTIFVSIHSLYKISKYKGKEGETPRLNRLGTGAWEKLKNRTKKQIKDIARELIQLYSRRREEKGFAFSPDSFLQQELEASFLYEDTPDQLKVTQEVKSDMEKDRPMDRLVCGDVGFGKTEIAIRAAFKATCDNKQVAVMVPTTVLALQHYKTFSARLKNFPVRIDYLTRAKTAAQTKQILKDLAEGKIDILIGTHKLIGKTVQFKDLGLLIIDEEQKFGVSVKEKLRQLKTNVDTLTMSATPIPRTLQFSLMGARDFSVLQTPPPNRYPVYTEIQQFGHELIADAVNFEMSRNGQVFIVSNRISALPNLAQIVRKYVPDARVAIGHGQMPPEQLEQIITGFINYDYDVLVSTTIVENGIDIPNANTIIIDSAQNFGLSDLHQMRGRVGRGNRKAFCYLMTPPLSQLPTDSRRRLEAIENFSDLGSGIHIAMQDLDIRGAGNLLGAEQSGFIADLGYETYQKILSEAVIELKNDEFSDLYKEEIQRSNDLSGDLFVNDCSFESDLPMYFKEDYIPTSSERMSLYRELDNLNTEEELEIFRNKLTDRFGPIPKEGEELLCVVALRSLGKSLGVEHLVIKNGRMILNFVSNKDSAFYQSATFDHCINYATKHYQNTILNELNGKRRMQIKGVDSVSGGVSILKEMCTC